ncbi:MAG TPA: aldolase [Methanospirillum sp.]|uniref:aldolase n=1 Tax=Methanospirillum sp. TaxID=45200 RepID=UPI002B6D59D5|nr:aldolase [Methanospirillum sp.]HWQ64397.1 aldolase [Methanospirillum sp.]
MVSGEEVSAEFKRFGNRLVVEHLVGANFGNMSVKTEDDGFLITRTGSYLDDPGELVYAPMSGEVSKTASSEWRVHRAVYQNTRHHAIVHAHPPYAVAASLMLDEVVPLDSEGKMFCPIIPIAHGEPGTQELAEDIAECLALSPLCIARGHGTFAAGKTIEEGYLFTSLGEHACRVLSLTRSFQG